jgi:hypothetical protein
MPKCEERFQPLKMLLTSNPILNILDLDKALIVCIVLHVLRELEGLSCKGTMLSMSLRSSRVVR